jgi:glucose-6-phosphate 1-dehydrogenase
LVVYGATGDLAARKLFPALFALHRGGQLDDWSLIGFARRPWTDDDFRAAVDQSLDADGAEKAGRAEFLGRCRYLAADFGDPAGYARLAAAVAPERELIHYLATPPERYAEIVGAIGAAGLAKRPAATRIVVEKPFGRDGAEAARLNACLAERFDEDSVFRIDHYLGKETVQNIAVFRFGNGMFEPVWNNRYVESVEITVAETVGVETRAAYYERSGALRDMVQNHLLQLLALVAMEPPSTMAAGAIHDEKVKVLRALRPIVGAAAAAATVRGRYASGWLDGAAVPAYRDEPGVAADSGTETYAALAVRIDSWRWAGVPFLLRTGKRLPRRLSEIAVRFKKPPLALFPAGWTGGNQLVFRIQPEEGLTLYLNTKIPGLADRSRAVAMDFLYGTGFGTPSPEAYERLILDALVGDSTLYARRDEVQAGWDFIDPIRAAWDEGLVELEEYAAGRAGPAGAKALAAACGRSWRRI